MRYVFTAPRQFLHCFSSFLFTHFLHVGQKCCVLSFNSTSLRVLVHFVHRFWLFIGAGSLAPSQNLLFLSFLSALSFTFSSPLLRKFRFFPFYHLTSSFMEPLQSLRMHWDRSNIGTRRRTVITFRRSPNRRITNNSVNVVKRNMNTRRHRKSPTKDYQKPPNSTSSESKPSSSSASGSKS